MGPAGRDDPRLRRRARHGEHSGGRERDDAALVDAALAGDRDAFAALVRRHRPMALALVAHMLGDGAAADAVQEEAVTALVGLERLRSPDRFGAWFAGIALNVARRWQRETVALLPPPLDLPADESGPAERAEAEAAAREVRRAVASLPPGQRAAVLAFYWGDRSHLEAADQLGITAGAVKARLHQARANLLRRLAPGAATSRSDPTTKEATAMPRSTEPPAAPSWVPARVAEVRRSEREGPGGRLHVVVLEEVTGDRRLAIYVGAAEATALACTLESLETPRPMTYAMAAGLVGAAGGRVLDVRVTTLAEDTFYAVVRVGGPGGAGEVDARPSDALNLALVCGAPVLVEEALLADGGAAPIGWATAWRGFPSAASAIAAEVRDRDSELAALRCAEGPPAGR